MLYPYSMGFQSWPVYASFLGKSSGNTQQANAMKKYLFPKGRPDSQVSLTEVYQQLMCTVSLFGTTPLGKYYYYPHFMTRKLKLINVGNWSKTTQPVNDAAETWMKAV